ncbi:hypothetical protein SAMN05443544_0512 [Agromyces cerinus subsp. cerinus]|uniref:Uncharacterized protein n=2 Tax=Agromyces cerinus TaxID=33878 RepID=A0A1N6DNL0_9MICO|nr:hypothetical protein SAMN05443544_0512 [Agromyces cerinus subsp. cerinus]
MGNKRSGAVVLTIGWLVPVFLGLYYNLWVLPSVANNGAQAAYQVLVEDGWPFAWLIAWIGLSGVCAVLLARQAARGGTSPTWIASLNAVLWCFVIVQAGSIIVSAVVSSSINSLGPLGPIPAGAFWSFGMMLAGFALLVGIVLSIRIRLLRDR